MYTKESTPLRRIADALPEARLEHALSRRQLAALSGVSASTIRRIERGDLVDPALLVWLGTVLVVLDVFRVPRFEDDLAALVPIGQPQFPGEEWAA
jgi:transcriptional regulator with XRE-family HTH domain